MELNTTDAALLFGALAVSLVAVYALVSWVQRALLHRRSRETQGQFVREILSEAIVQRSVLQLDFDSPELKRYKATGICAGVTGTHIQVDMNGSFATASWSGEGVVVQFQVSFRRKPSYFRFHSRVLGVTRRGGIFVMRLALPQYVGAGQKRRTLRIKPPIERVMHMRLWFMDVADPIPAFVADLPPTVLEFRPGVREALRLEDISAGGVRLTLVGDEIEQPLTSLPAVPRTRVLLLIILLTGEDSPPLALWLLGKIINVMEHEGLSLSLAVQFSHWATVQGSAVPLSWLPAPEESGVAPLSAWIMRMHLEQSKHL